MWRKAACAAALRPRSMQPVRRLASVSTGSSAADSADHGGVCLNNLSIVAAWWPGRPAAEVHAQCAGRNHNGLVNSSRVIMLLLNQQNAEASKAAIRRVIQR